MERTQAADALCARALEETLAGKDEAGVALVAVGGYGRRELAPYSDLDVVLVHADQVDVRELATNVWYPLWNEGVDIDHSVRALSEVTDAAKSDPRVALGLLDARHLAGDPSITLMMRTSLLAQWRREARHQLPALKELVNARSRRLGELAHASVPDIKESIGGLRDATVLNALVATWLVDVPHADLERCRLQMLDVRDALHDLAGRATDRIGPELWPELAERLGQPDAEAAQRQVREIGRRITHLSRLTWRRVDAVLARPSGTRRRAPEMQPVASGVAISAGEVVLARGTVPADDPLLLLRAACEAAERDLVLAPPTAARLARDGADLPEPWGAEARNLFTRLLASGTGLLAVWETLDETGALARVLPEWERVRLLPHASVVHRFTVDRHLVETCIEASRMIRRVARPDVLMVASILHDMGKGGSMDHSVAGEPIAADAAARMGFEPDEVALITNLVRWHLLLSEVATTRDLEDPATVEYVVTRVDDTETLDLLEVLTEADARATAAKAWTAWRAGLVSDLARRVRLALLQPEDDFSSADEPEHVDIPDRVRKNPDLVDVRLAVTGDGTRITVVSGDRIGLMAAAAGALAIQGLSIRSARAWTQDEYAISVWDVADTEIDEAILRQRFDAVISGQVKPADRLRQSRPGPLEPSVLVRHEASNQATVLEVRVDDRPGVVHLVCAALAEQDLSVRSAHVSTLGPQAVDVFYVQEHGAAGLADDRAAAAVHAVRRALTDAATLDS
jgi:[protein-PII] uridylyltransferase